MRISPEPDPPVPQRPADRLDRIGETLRRAYDEAATETLPQTFEDLLKQLR